MTAHYSITPEKSSDIIAVKLPKRVKALAIEYVTNMAEASVLAGRIASVFPEVPVYMSDVSPVIGTHAGPNILAVTVLDAD